MRKPDFRLCENTGADQLCSNCTADQRLCFRYTDSTIYPPLIPKISNSCFLPRLYRPVCVAPGQKTLDRFSRVVAQITAELMINERKLLPSYNVYYDATFDKIEV